ncbi:MAG TPA: methyltransferase domain-containing protein [Methylomirabilota bacterium]|nr:methyltransferase domain-containing protein [Methylomirabilota bacterium]
MSVLNIVHAAATDPQEAERIAAIVAPRLPASLVPVFDARFGRSWALYDEFVYRLTLRVFCEAGLAAAVDDWGNAEKIAGRAGVDPRRAVGCVSWILGHLARRGVLAREDTIGGPRFRAEHEITALDPAPIAVAQREHDPACLPAYVLAETAAREYPGFLRGGASGEAILFAPSRLPLWLNYFSNDNVLYAVNNRVGAVAVETWMLRRPGTILELGGGLASGAAALFERLAGAGRLGDVQTYRFTELVPLFLRRGQRLLQERFPEGPPLAFAPLDMNRPFADQGVSPESVSVVYAVNTLHVAHDLAFTLGEVRRALEPGGQLIVSECVRPRPLDTLSPELMFNLLETFRSPRLHSVYRPNGGFLTPEQWRGALEAAGFRDVRMLPDVVRIREDFPGFCVAAIGATRPA